METIYCANCGAKNSKESRFCKKCGEQLIPNESDKNKCSSCGFNAEKEEKYCPECGAQLTALDTKNEIPPSVKPVVKKPKPHTTTKRSISNEKKGGCSHTLKKVTLWFIAIVVLGIVGLYIIGDTKDNIDTQESAQKVEEPIKVREANAVLTNEVSFPVVSSSKEQVFNYSDSIKISIPPNFTSKEQQLNVSRAEVDPAIMIEGAIPLSLIDLTLNEGEQPSKPVEVSFNYDPSKLGSFNAEERLEAFRWDEEGGGWVSLPIRIDEKENTAYAYVDHFSIIELVLTGVGYEVGILMEEKILNDIYFTPDKNFKILYSKKAILADPELNTMEWKGAETGRSRVNKSNAPPYVQAVGYILEEALKSYTGKPNGFKNPTGKEEGCFGTYQKTITVKIDSYYSNTFAKGNPSYEKLFECIHIPTSIVFQANEANFFLAHELFHRIQAEYYGTSGMLKGACSEVYTGTNCWWLEATADYAAFQIAFNPPISGIDNGIGNDYLRYPLDMTGLISNTGENYGWGSREYEYVTSIWIKYLFDHGSVLKEMIEEDASNYSSPIESLENYLWSTQKRSIDDVYRDFAAWMIFSKEGALNHYKLATGNIKNDIAIKEDVLKLGEGKQVNYSFKMPNHFTSKLWTIKIEKKDDKDVTIHKKTPIIVNFKKKSTGTIIDIFIIPKGQRYPKSTKPIKRFHAANQSQMIMVEEGELLCVVATQGSIPNGSAEVIVRDGAVQLEISPSEILDAKSKKLYSFEIKATEIPEEIKKVKIEWDFSDGTKKSLSDIDVISESAKIEIEHEYENSDQEEIYPLKVLLKDDNTGITLAEVNAFINLPLEKPQVFITERHLVGPPGATFDMEALASPENTYKFVWTVKDWSGDFTQTGKKSGIAPVITKIGKYTYTVKLYSLDDEYFATDRATIYVEPEELDTPKIDGIETIDDKKTAPYKHIYNWEEAKRKSDSIMKKQAEKEMEYYKKQQNKQK